MPKKIQKKSKNDMLEVPDYLTQEELLKHFEERKKQQRDNFNNGGEGYGTQGKNQILAVQENIGFDDNYMEFDQRNEMTQDYDLEDCFLKGQFIKYFNDPFYKEELLK